MQQGSQHLISGRDFPDYVYLEGELPQRPLTPIFLQKHGDINGSHLLLKRGVVQTTSNQEGGMLLQKHRGRSGRCIAITSKSGVDVVPLIDVSNLAEQGRMPSCYLIMPSWGRPSEPDLPRVACGGGKSMPRAALEHRTQDVPCTPQVTG